MPILQSLLGQVVTAGQSPLARESSKSTRLTLLTSGDTRGRDRIETSGGQNAQCAERSVSKTAKLYIVLISTLGLAALANGLDPWKSADMGRFLCYLLIATAASGLKVSLPGMTGTMSVNFLFILIGVAELELSETMLIAW